MAGKKPAKDVIRTVAEKTGEVAQDAGRLAKNAKNAVVEKIDLNHDGKIGVEDVILLAVKTPGVFVSREKFLKRELFKNHPQEVIEKAILTTPAQAGISPEEVSKIADEVIKIERIQVSGISAALGAPGGWAMAATIPADIGQYYACTLRVAQKLLYLYGFPELAADEQGLVLDSETLNAIIVCLGVMNGVAGANNAIKAIAHALASGVERKLLKMALTKGAVYPIVKSIMKWFGISLTKALFAGAVKKAIPIVGGVVGGSVTFFSFKPCCYRLKNALTDTMLSNPNHITPKEESTLLSEILSGEVIDVESVDVDDKEKIND